MPPFFTRGEEIMITVYEKDGTPIQLDGVDARERIAAGLAFASKVRKEVPVKVPDGKVKVIDNDGVEHVIDGVDARERVEAGLATLVDPDALSDVKPDDNELDDEHDSPLVAAICRMDRSDVSLWTENGEGRPSVKALSKEAGIEVNSNERNAAWDMYIDWVSTKDGD